MEKFRTVWTRKNKVGLFQNMREGTKIICQINGIKVEGILGYFEGGGVIYSNHAVANGGRGVPKKPGYDYKWVFSIGHPETQGVADIRRA